MLAGWVAEWFAGWVVGFGWMGGWIPTDRWLDLDGRMNEKV